MRITYHKVQGLSLIELMIAILIGLLLLLGITGLFSTTSNVNRMENGLARLQENGRFALARISQDIRMATSTRSVRKGAGGAASAVAPDRSILSLVDFGAPLRLHHGLPGADGAAPSYYIPRSFLIRGHDCAGMTCQPADPPGAAGNGADHYDGGIPVAGAASGQRARGADVLTLRYVNGMGVAVNRSVPLPDAEGAGTIQLDAPIDVGSSGLIVVDDYQRTILLAVAEAGTTGVTELTPTGNLSNAPGGLAALTSLSGDIRVSDFDSDFVTVSYFLRLSTDPSSAGRLISTLIRRENGSSQEIAQGIERLDFLYHVEDINGEVSIRSANQITGPMAVGFACSRLDPDPGVLVTLDAPFCPWRGVRAVEVFLLANTIDDAGSHQEPYLYSFLENGDINADSSLRLACDPSFGTCPGGSVTSLPSGLPPGRMLRREFRSVVTLRSNAY